MRLFLQLHIRDWKDISYQTPLLNYASSLADDVIGADLDYQSEAYVADLILRLVEQADELMLLVSAAEGLPMGSCLPVISHLMRVKEKVVQAVLYGEHAMATKMLVPFQERFHRSNDEDQVKSLIRAFCLKG